MRVLSWCLALLVLLPQCGGGNSAGGGGEVQSAADASRATKDDERESDVQAASDDDGEIPSAEKSKSATCDDGTCSRCGDGICPSGWYCDEKAGACSWLTECADKATCGCVTRVLGAACKCREEDGGLKVTCD
jgi:hypothetical protein